MKIEIDLPGASQFDAVAFGLWVGTLIADAEPETVVGDIRVVSQ